jgi:MarR family transcriptional regulator, lower aerobic nicotinate degradation pathway regulator
MISQSLDLSTLVLPSDIVGPVADPHLEYDPPGRVRRMPSWLVGQAGQRAQALVAQALAGEGMRRQHFTVLTSLAEQGPASQAALGRRLWIDPSDLHAIVGELERGSLIARDRDPEDRRRNVVRLTAAGRTALKRLDALVEGAQRDFLSPLSANDRRQLVRLLEQLVDSPNPTQGRDSP